MSHFVVMVVGDVDKQLAPFDESLKVAPYRVPVSEEDLEDMLSFYKDKNFPFTSNIDECYAKYGQNWNNNKWQKDEKGWFMYQREILSLNGMSTVNKKHIQKYLFMFK